MLASSTAFGMQKIVLQMSLWSVSKWLISSLLLLAFILLWLPKTPLRINVFMLKMTLLLIFIRFSIPGVFIVNELLYKEFMQAQTQAATQQIVQNQKDLQQMTMKISENIEQPASPVERLLQMMDVQSAVKERMQQLKQQATELARQLSTAMIDLMGVLILQTLILPLVIFYALYRMLVFILKQDVIEWISKE
jgi:hypothetical protein